MEQAQKQSATNTQPQKQAAEANANARSEQPKAENGHKTTGKLALAGIFALGGWKITTFVTTKIGIVVDGCATLMTTLINGGSLKEAGALAWKQCTDAMYQSGRALIFRPGAHKELFKVAPFSAAGFYIGSALGIIGGVVLAFTRGDRLDNAWDLFKHPIDSMKKIFSKEKPKHEPVTAVEEAKAPTAEHAAKPTQTRDHVHEGKVATPEKSLAV